MSALLRGPLGLHVIQCPNGRFSCVGAVPVDLAYVYESAADLEIAKHSGPGFARRIAEREGRVFHTRTWATREDAEVAVAAWRASQAES